MAIENPQASNTQEKSFRLTETQEVLSISGILCVLCIYISVRVPVMSGVVLRRIVYLVGATRIVLSVSHRPPLTKIGLVANAPHLVRRMETQL